MATAVTHCAGLCSREPALTVHPPEVEEVGTGDLRGREEMCLSIVGQVGGSHVVRVSDAGQFSRRPWSSVRPVD